MVGSSLYNDYKAIVVVNAMNSDVITSDYLDVTLLRSEADGSDTCNVRAVSVRGAMVTYPGGLQYFMPVKEMVVQ